MVRLKVVVEVGGRSASITAAIAGDADTAASHVTPACARGTFPPLVRVTPARAFQPSHQGGAAGFFFRFDRFVHGEKFCARGVDQRESTFMTQVSLRLPQRAVQVDIDDVRKQPTGAGAISLCASKSGRLDKVIAADIGAQEAVWSRIQTTGKGFSLEQLSLLMDTCGNEAPLHWLLLHRNYDPSSLRKLETDTERRLREAEERIYLLEHDKRVLTEALRGQP